MQDRDQTEGAKTGYFPRHIWFRGGKKFHCLHKKWKKFVTAKGKPGPAGSFLDGEKDGKDGALVLAAAPAGGGVA